MSYLLRKTNNDPFTGAILDLLLNGVFAEIHVHDNPTGQTIPNGTGYTKITQFADNGDSREMTPNQVSNQIEVDHDGKYKISGSFSYASGVQNVEFFLGVFLDGVEQDQIHWTRKVGTAGDVGSSSCHGFVDATEGQVIDVRIRHDNGGSVVTTISYGNLNALLVGIV